MLTARIGLNKQRKLPACQVPQKCSRSSLGSMFFFFLIYHHVTFSAILKPFSLLNSEFKVNVCCGWFLSAGDLGWCSGVASGGDSGVLRSGFGFWFCDRVLFLQPAEQQLPSRRVHRVWSQLHDICSGHAGGVCCAGLQSQNHRHRVC